MKNVQEQNYVTRALVMPQTFNEFNYKYFIQDRCEKGLHVVSKIDEELALPISFSRFKTVYEGENELDLKKKIWNNFVVQQNKEDYLTNKLDSVI